jgi:tetratricopeptide (TPR) repeat protein
MSRARSLAAFALVLICLSGGAKSSANDPVDAALDLYDRGAFDAALLAIPANATKANDFITAANRWIVGGSESTRARRRLIAAALAAELIWARVDSASQQDANHTDFGDFSGERPLSSWNTSLPLLSWACTLMPSSGGVAPQERWWWLESVALFETTHYWRALIGRQHTNIAGAGVSREAADGHLMHARQRLPDEPRWRLADAMARTAIDFVPGRPGGRPDLLRNREATNASDDKKLLAAERSFEPLVNVTGIAGEAELRIAQLELRRRQWSSALAHLDRARPLVAGQEVLPAATDYFAGWAYEHLNRPEDAIAAYRRALDREPMLRQPATLLAAQLFLVHEPSDAHAILLGAFAASPEPHDLGLQIEHADGRLMPGYIRQLREALR